MEKVVVVEEKVLGGRWKGFRDDGGGGAAALQAVTGQEKE